MTAELTLPIVAPSSAAQPNDHAQWRIDSIQMVNWGGFHGAHQVRFHHGSTLIPGTIGALHFSRAIRTFAK